MRHFLFGALLAFFVPTDPDASVLFTFERISDTEANVTATGSPDTGFLTGVNIGRFNRLEFDNIVEGFSGNATVDGDFQIGATTLLGFTAIEIDLFNDDALFFDDSAPSVSARLTLNGVAWAPVGATNQILSNFESQSQAAGNSQTNVKIGEWVMVAPVPLPAAAWFLLAGVGSFLAMSRKKRRV